MQVGFQNLYKQVLEVPSVIEAKMEEWLLKIGEIMKGFRINIQDIQMNSTLGMPPEVHEGRLRMEMIAVAKIKKFEDECENFCEESVKVWEELMGNPEMKVVKDKLCESQEQANEEANKVTTLPPVERMDAILDQ
jgi:hypothetical protein